MAARRCPDCLFSYPVQVLRCHVCEAETEYMPSGEPNPEWEADVRRLLERPRQTEEQARVEAWRLRTTLDLGFSLDLAEQLAGSQADLHDLERLVGSGCPLPLAAEILL